MGVVYLVGAGPGDPDLLTVKAHRLVREADIILYDRLVSPEILEGVREDCKKIYVGKEESRHLLPQEEINQLLGDCARRYDTVVRLKGGDPFVFGRGGEEAQYLQSLSIPFEVVPGISSSIAAPAYAGIPVTHRGVAASFAVITGHRAKENCPHFESWESLPHIDTLVFLMSVKNRRTIASRLVKAGRREDEPVAFVHRGTTSQQMVKTSTLAGVVAGEEGEIKPPAIMVVGKVVSLRDEIRWFSPNGEKVGLPQ